MADKDFTDIVIMTLDSGERVYHLAHLRHLKDMKMNGVSYPVNGHDYLLNLDRATRIKWAPWPKFKSNPLYRSTPYWKKPYWVINEFLRSKKIGLLLYQEPGAPKEVKMVTDCECSCGFKGVTMRGTKIHTKAAGLGHTLKETYSTTLMNVVKEPIEPLHISRIHQPSGEMTE